MNIGYVRVSSADQNLTRQYELLKHYNIEKYFEEKQSAKTTKREQLQNLLSFVREGDTVYIESISRLARNTVDFLKIIEKLNGKKVSLISLKESIDTTSPSGKFMLTVFAALSQLERETIKQRQREGIDAAKAKGCKFGRPRKISEEEFMKYYNKWKNGEIRAVDAIRATGYSPSRFYGIVRQMNSQ